MRTQRAKPNILGLQPKLSYNTKDFVTYVCKMNKQEALAPDFSMTRDNLVMHMKEALNIFNIWLNMAQVKFSLKNWSYIEGLIWRNAEWNIGEINQIITQIFPIGCPMFALQKYLGLVIIKADNKNIIPFIFNSYKHMNTDNTDQGTNNIFAIYRYKYSIE